MNWDNLEQVMERIRDILDLDDTEIRSPLEELLVELEVEQGLQEEVEDCEL